MLTTIDDNGNTIGDDYQIGDFSNDSNLDSHLVGNVVSIIHVFSDTDCVGIGNFGNPIVFLVCVSDEGSSSSQVSYCQFLCQQYLKRYNAPPPPSCSSSTNKHKHQRPVIHLHFDDDVTMILSRGFSF